MKAVGYRANWPVDHAEALLDVELPAPVPGARDVLVRVKAVSVNPVDTKVRKGSQPPEGQVKVLGWDAVGTVEAVGAGCTTRAPSPALGPTVSCIRWTSVSWRWLPSRFLMSRLRPCR